MNIILDKIIEINVMTFLTLIAFSLGTYAVIIACAFASFFIASLSEYMMFDSVSGTILQVMICVNFLIVIKPIYLSNKMNKMKYTP